MSVLAAHEPLSVRPEGATTGVLLVHGFTGGPASLIPLAHRFAEAGHAVEVPLLPGHGTRWQDLARTGYADWRATALAAYDELASRCDRVFVLGLSAGGALSLEIAAARDDVAGLILINPAVHFPAVRRMAARLLRRVIRTRPAIADDIAKAGVTEHAYPRTPVGAAHTLMQGATTLRSGLWRVTAPLLLMTSARDAVVPEISSTVVWDEVRSTERRRIILRRSHHVATLDHDADLIAEASLGFLTSGHP